MKKTLLALLLFPIAGFSQIFHEDFENGIPPTWTQQVTGPGQWEADNVLFGWYYMDSTIAYFNDDILDEYETTPWAELVTPVIDLTGYENIQLSFDYFNLVFFDDAMFTVGVYDGTAWVDVFQVIGDAVIETESDIYLLSAQLDVSNYINEDFQIRFVYNDAGNWSFGAGIDNVMLDGQLSVKPLRQTQTVLAPNPVCSSFGLQGMSDSEAENDAVTVSDLNGKILRTFSSQSKYDVSDLPAGTYMVKINTGGTQIAKKLIKQ